MVELAGEKCFSTFLETKQQDNFLSYLVKSKGNGNRVFSEERISVEINNAIFTTTPIQYNWSMLLDRFMMNTDIKLFLMLLGCMTFGEVNAKEVCAYFECSSIDDDQLVYWHDRCWQ